MDGKRTHTDSPLTCLFCNGPMDYDPDHKRHVCKRLCASFIHFSLLRDTHEARDNTQRMCDERR